MICINTANIHFKLDPKSLESHTMEVERMLEPLVTVATTLVYSSNEGPSNTIKEAHLLADLVAATQKFLEEGEKIAKDSQFLKDELTAAVEDVRKQGESMKLSSGEFAEDPTSSVKRDNMISAARPLLSAVAHLLVLADMLDIYTVLLQLKLVEERLAKVHNARTKQDLGVQYKALKQEGIQFSAMAAKRQQDLKDVHHKNQMAAARGDLQRNIPMLYMASCACLQHPDIEHYKANRDLIYEQLQYTISGISNATQATPTKNPTQPAGGGELAYALNHFDKQLIVDPLVFSEECLGSSLQERLESIISSAALMADPSSTDDHKESILAECNQALQDLLSVYTANAGRKDRSDTLNTAISRMTKKTRELRQQLRKVVTNHVSVSFLETNAPCLVLIEVAKNGKEMEINKNAQVFSEHANKLIEVANMACSISDNEEGVNLVRMAVSQLESLCPLVINAALALASKPNSRISQDNIKLFQEQWEKKVCVLTDAIDNIISIEDFLCVTENHILENVNKCVIALQENDVDGLDRSAGAIRGHAARVVHVANSEMDNYETGIYTEKVLEAAKLLTDTVLPSFKERVEALNVKPTLPVDEKELIGTSRLVYDSVHNIRNAVLMSRTQEEELHRTKDPDNSNFETKDFDVGCRTSVHTKEDQTIAGQSVVYDGVQNIRKDGSDALNTSRVTEKTRELRQQLRKAVTDYVSVSFLETNVPCLALIEAAKNGKEKEILKYVQVFSEHANKLIEVANMACSVSNNEEGVSLVCMAVSQLESLCPLVINAALALASKPSSRISQDNMNLFQEQWEKKVCILKEVIDNIKSIDDFLFVTENHILEDVNKCVIALQENDVDGLDRSAGAIRGYAARVVRVATSEMDNYETGVYTEKVLEATKLLTDTVMPPFIEQVEAAVEALNANPTLPVNKNELIDVSRLVYDSVHNIRNAVLLTRTQEEELDRSDGLNTSISRMTTKTRELRQQLRKAVTNHVSVSFLETNVPCLALIEAAKNGKEEEIQKYTQVFSEHANKLIEVANMACSVSNNEEGVNLVRMAVSQLETICPLVINAALALASKPSNRISLDNMNLIREKWEKKVCILSDAIDNITSIDDFLYLTENHILEDVNKCVIALQENDVDGLNRTAGAIRGHAARVVRVATSEMENYDTGIYTKKVLEATKLLTDTVIPPFIEQVEAAVEALNAKPILPVDENKFIGTSRLVYDSVHNIRKAVLMITTQEEELDRTKDPDNSDFETKDLDAGCRTSVHTEDDQAIAGQSTRAIMAQLPQEQKEKIAEEVASFVEEKNKLDAEVSKWEDSGDDNENDIVMLAKQMCMIMMEMTDFTRGQGPLKNTSDVISAAKKIAKAGSRMEKLGHTVIDNCLDSTCKKDLLAYLQRIPLYCHQLNICSKVKAEIQNMGGELVISGIDSAMSLIQAAKNLMNAVVSTVKTCYAASKYRKSQGTQSLNMPTNSWRMKVPEKKPLVKQDDKVGQKNKDKHVNPMQALSEFKALDSI